MKSKNFVAIEHELTAVLPTKFNECPQTTRLMKASIT